VLCVVPRVLTVNPPRHEITISSPLLSKLAARCTQRGWSFLSFSQSCWKEAQKINKLLDSRTGVDDDDVFRRQDGRDGWMNGPGQWQLLDKATGAKRRRFFPRNLANFDLLRGSGANPSLRAARRISPLSSIVESNVMSKTFLADFR
jgi:hypothetical protein